MIKKKGFTLVEVLTVVFLSVIIVAAGYYLYLVSFRSFSKNSASAELTQNARIALERMSRDIRQSMDIVTALPESPEEGTVPSELKFQDGHNFWPTAGSIQYITYYLQGNDLHRKVSHFAFPDAPNDWVLWSTIRGTPAHPESPTEISDPQDDVIKAQHITSVQFWGNQLVTIHLTVSDTKNTYEFETKTLGRNVQ